MGKESWRKRFDNFAESAPARASSGGSNCSEKKLNYSAMTLSLPTPPENKVRQTEKDSAPAPFVLPSRFSVPAPPTPYAASIYTSSSPSSLGDFLAPTPSSVLLPSNLSPRISTQQLVASRKGGRLPASLGIAGAFIAAFVAIFVLVRRRKQRQNKDEFPKKADISYYTKYGSQRGRVEIGGSKVIFSYADVMEMTNGFSEENIIGEGGFGCVYKGQLPDGKVVAVKNLRKGGKQGDREFKAEVEIMSRASHQHIATLVGYCISEDQRVLIYNLLPNKTLEHHLHGKGTPVLEWSKRLKIARGAAKGLEYLHEDCHPKIIHRDIKSANILLDDDFEARVADFGLARPDVDGDETHVSTRVMGTVGYMAPEYAASGKLTQSSDVYSFGVVLLELITGRKPIDSSQPQGYESLVEWARPLLKRALEANDYSILVDPRLEKQYVESELHRVIQAASVCIRHSARRRPHMTEVVKVLNHEGETSGLMTNGTTSCQSTLYNTGQYDEDIQRIRRIAFSSGDWSWDFESSGDYSSQEHAYALQSSSRVSSDAAGQFISSGFGIHNSTNCSQRPSFTQKTVTALDAHSSSLSRENDASMTLQLE